MLFRWEWLGPAEGRCGTGGIVGSVFCLPTPRLEEEPSSLTDEGGVELPLVEFRVEEDLAVGTVPLESLEESEVRTLALERLRSSLKKGMLLEAMRNN